MRYWHTIGFAVITACAIVLIAIDRYAIGSILLLCVYSLLGIRIRKHMADTQDTYRRLIADNLSRLLTHEDVPEVTVHPNYQVKIEGVTQEYPANRLIARLRGRVADEKEYDSIHEAVKIHD